jgi:hypothetical protein
VVTGRRGASSTGCLISLLIFVAVLYYGVNIGEVFFRYYRLVDEMQSQARLASAIDNGTIQRRLQAAIQDPGRSASAACTVRRCIFRCSITPSRSIPRPLSRCSGRAA